MEIPRAFFMVLGAIALIVSDKSRIYCFMAFLAPVATGISYTYISIVACIILLFKIRTIRLNKIAVGCIIAILIIEMLSIFRFEFDFMEYIRFAGVFLICFLRMADVDESYDNLAMLKFFNFGFIITTISLWGQMLAKYSFVAILTMGIRFGNTHAVFKTEEMMISFNQNMLAFLCITTIWISYFLYKFEGKALHLTTFFVATIQGVMTQSRAFILAFVLTLGLLVFAFSENIKKAIQAIIAWVTVIVAAGIVLFEYLESYIESFILRFKVSDITGGRTTIMGEYFDAFFEDPSNLLFGVGLQDYFEKYGLEAAAHNSLQEILVTWGFVGLFFVLVLFFVILKMVKYKNPQVKLIQYAPFLIYILLTQSAQGFSDRAGLLRLMVTYSVMMVTFQKITTNTFLPDTESDLESLDEA